MSGSGVFVIRYCSYALFDLDGNKVPPELVVKVGETFESILKEASFSFAHYIFVFLLTMNHTIFTS